MPGALTFRHEIFASQWVESKQVIHPLYETSASELNFPQAQSFGVIDRSIDGENADYASMIQQLNRFILEEFSVEGNTFPHNPYLIPSGDDSRSITFAAAPITQLLGVDAKTVTICTNCGFKRVKDLMSHVVDLIYPRKVCTGRQQMPE